MLSNLHNSRLPNKTNIRDKLSSVIPIKLNIVSRRHNTHNNNINFNTLLIKDVLKIKKSMAVVSKAKKGNCVLYLTRDNYYFKVHQ